MLETGQAAPDFTLPRDGGDAVTLSDVRPSPVILFFYPKDDTSSCTKEAVSFTELSGAFEEAGGKVCGISKDTVAKHDKFRDKHSLGIPLLSDAETEVCEAYGVWKEKKMYGKTYMGIERTTVLIDGAGNVVQVWPKVRVPGHADAVLEAVKAM